ncbi:MAG: plasmid mobilization relaxosome protein MobC [Firmicutes bacterium]|nr:plasmid mobilization relaxosome protein MobC [Bacillota bacterium]
MANRLRKEQIIIRVMPEEKEIIKQKMKETNSRTYFDLIMRSIATHETIKINTKPLSEIANELNRIGNNLNQLTKAVNTSKDLNDSNAHNLQESIEDIKTEIKELKATNDNILRIFSVTKKGKYNGLFENSINKDG